MKGTRRCCTVILTAIQFSLSNVKKEATGASGLAEEVLNRAKERHYLTADSNCCHHNDNGCCCSIVTRARTRAHTHTHTHTELASNILTSNRLDGRRRHKANVMIIWNFWIRLDNAWRSWRGSRRAPNSCAHCTRQVAELKKIRLYERMREQVITQDTHASLVHNSVW